MQQQLSFHATQSPEYRDAIYPILQGLGRFYLFLRSGKKTVNERWYKFRIFTICICVVLVNSVFHYGHHHPFLSQPFCTSTPSTFFVYVYIYLLPNTLYSLHGFRLNLEAEEPRIRYLSGQAGGRNII